MFDLQQFGGRKWTFGPQRYLAHERQPRDQVYLIRDGWAARYRRLPDGRRQITALYLPGDLCDLGWLQEGQADQAVKTLTPVDALGLSRDLLLDVCDRNVAMRAHFWRTMIEAGTRQSEWTVNLGRKNAIERISHFFCELHQRLRASGLATQSQFPMPLTQVDLADIVGLTPVHVNRTLQDMRMRGLIDLQARCLHILAPDALRSLGFYTAVRDGGGHPPPLAA